MESSANFVTIVYGSICHINETSWFPNTKEVVGVFTGNEVERNIKIDDYTRKRNLLLNREGKKLVLSFVIAIENPTID